MDRIAATSLLVAALLRFHIDIAGSLASFENLLFEHNSAVVYAPSSFLCLKIGKKESSDLLREPFSPPTFTLGNIAFEPPTQPPFVTVAKSKTNYPVWQMLLF